MDSDMEHKTAVDSGHHIIGHDSMPVFQLLKPLYRKGLNNVKKAKKNKP